MSQFTCVPAAAGTTIVTLDDRSDNGYVFLPVIAWVTSGTRPMPQCVGADALDRPFGLIADAKGTVVDSYTGRSFKGFALWVLFAKSQQNSRTDADEAT